MIKKIIKQILQNVQIKCEFTSTRQISRPALWPAVWKAGCITFDLDGLFPCVLVGGAITPVFRPPTVAPKQSFVNEISNTKLFAKLKMQNVNMN